MKESPENSEITNMKTEKTSPNEHPTYFFLIGKDSVLGTPNAMGASGRTLDIPFHQLAKNYDLQTRLKMLSSVLLRPACNPPLAYPMEGRELIETAAGYLSAFCSDPEERKKQRSYLVDNGLVRVLVTNEDLLVQVKEAVAALSCA